MKEFCHHMPCRELRHRQQLYLMKSELLRHLRREHGRLWTDYERIFESGRGRRARERRSEKREEYSERARDLLTRCRMLDSLYANLQPIDLLEVEDFGNYCKRVFTEINRLRPAFPECPVSVSVFDTTARDLRKFVMQQNDRWEERVELREREGATG